jgi:hypothetical protein
VTRHVVVTADTTVISNSGRGSLLPAGRYEVAELDGTAERGQLFLYGPNDGALVRANPSDPNLTIEES